MKNYVMQNSGGLFGPVAVYLRGVSSRLSLLFQSFEFAVPLTNLISHRREENLSVCGRDIPNS